MLFFLREQSYKRNSPEEQHKEISRWRDLTRKRKYSRVGSSVHLACLQNSNNKNFDVTLISRRSNGDRYPPISSRAKNKISNDLNNSNNRRGTQLFQNQHLTSTIWLSLSCDGRARFPPTKIFIRPSFIGRARETNLSRTSTLTYF